MSKLYHELASDYHDMYQTIFDYEREYSFHKDIFVNYHCKNIIEVGCGTGNLAERFLRDGFLYTGTDISYDMLTIAIKNNPNAKFVQCDMRELKLHEMYDAAFISGRSFTYMISNDDVLNALKSINKALKPNGLFIFDNFNAEVIFGNFKEYMESESKNGQKIYKRKNINHMNLTTGWTWDWDATYIISELEKETRIINDKSTLRAFTCDELNLFLKLANFSVINSEKKDFWIRTISEKKA